MARFLRSTATYKLRPPVNFATAVFAAGAPRLARAQRQARTYYRLRPPATLVQPVVVYPGPRANYRIAVRRAVEQHVVTSALFPPTIVDPVITAQGDPVPPLSRKLARPRPSRTVKSVLRPPATLAQAAVSFTARRPIVRLAATSKRPFTTSTLLPPSIVDPVVTAQGDPVPPLARKLARSIRQTRTTTSILRKPVVLGVVVATPPFAPVRFNYRVSVARSFQKRSFGNTLQAPTVVDPAVSGDNPVGSIFDPNYFLILHA